MGIIIRRFSKKMCPHFWKFQKYGRKGKVRKGLGNACRFLATIETILGQIQS
jgi:hypothetical protein